MTWVKIDDSDVRHYWVHDADDLADERAVFKEGGDAPTPDLYVSPGFYDESGTPICAGCGDDLKYHHTEVRRGLPKRTNQPKERFQYVCSSCGSTLVKADADVTWSVARQAWELCSWSDNYTCSECGGACGVVQVALQGPCKAG